jgi:tRNA (guanine26-N2/guanine27-N2)-dimethyltransferase
MKNSIADVYIHRSALLNANYAVSYSHCNKNSVKTNAPSNVIWEILSKYVKNKPISEKWLQQNYPVYHILKNTEKPSQEYDFTIRYVTNKLLAYNSQLT